MYVEVPVYWKKNSRLMGDYGWDHSGETIWKKGTRKKEKFAKKEERGKRRKNKSKDGIINAKEQN